MIQFIAGLSIGLFILAIALIRGRANKEVIERQERYHKDLMNYWENATDLQHRQIKALETLADRCRAQRGKKWGTLPRKG